MSTNPARDAARRESRCESDGLEPRNSAAGETVTTDPASVASVNGDPRDSVTGTDLDRAMTEWKTGR